MELKREHYDRLRLGVGLTEYPGYQTFEISGSTAADALNRLVLSDLARLPIGRILATYMTREDGSLLADVMIWNQGGRFLLIAESGKPESLLSWIQTHATGAAVKELTAETALIGLDGPFAWEVLKETLGVRILGVRYLETMADQKLFGITTDVIRAGKTGEYGYVLRCHADDAARLRQGLLEAGQAFHIAACDPAAVELCKLENRFTNVFKEGAAASNVLELNCRIQVSFEKGDYVGSEAINKAMATGAARRLIGLKFEGSAVPREGGAVSYKGEPIGTLVSSGFSFTLDAPIGVALLSSAYAFVGCEYETAGAVKARTVSAPFVLNKSLQIRPQEDSFKTVDWSFRP